MSANQESRPLLDMKLSGRCDMSVEELFAHYAKYMPGAGSCGEWLVFVDVHLGDDLMADGKQITLHNRITGERHQRVFTP